MKLVAGPTGDTSQSLLAAQYSFSILGTRVNIRPGFFANLLALWAAMSWQAGRAQPRRGVLARILVGGLSTAVLIWSDLGHAFAHTLSARYAGAPTDEIRLSSGMPRTIYYDNDVLPRVHMARSIGGPIFSVLGLCLSALARALAPPGSTAREVASWSAIGHGLILAGSLAPLLIVDGGVILKWSLVDRGRTPPQADLAVQQAGLVTGAAAAGMGMILATRHRWLPAIGFMAAGLVAIAAARGKIR